MQAIETLNKFFTADNIADILENDRLDEIGAEVVREYEIDLASRKEWKDDYDKAMKLALQVAETKNYPWANAANVKYPLLTTAAIQFAARAYPAIVPSKNVVKADVNGKDEDGAKRKRADRVARHMSWQLINEMEEWEEDTDKLLHILPIAGLAYRKTYYNPSLGRNTSELVEPVKLVVNDGVKNLALAPRITHQIERYPQEIIERQRAGTYREIEIGLAPGSGGDEDAPHDFLEQHRALDLDDDGYKEPYIVTVHKETSQVVRIIPNFRQQDIAVNEAGEIAKISRDQYFTKYPFIPNPSGGFHDIGFGYLLRPINEAVNSTLNQLLDAGHISNLGGGFIGAGARLRGGQLRFKPGDWKKVDVGGGTLRENIVPLPVKEPSIVLFQLLGMLIDAGKDISSVKDVLTGGENQSANASPTTTLALIEQGMQVFSAIYKRVFRSLKSEYRKLYKLNSIYLDEETYFTLIDEQEAIGKEDYAMGDFDITPAADPQMVTNMQRLGRAEFLMQFANDPHFNGMEIRKRMLDAASIADADILLVEEMPPDADIARKADEIDIKKHALQIKENDMQSVLVERSAKTLKLLAEAEAAEAGPQMEMYKQDMALLQAMAKGETQSVDRGTIPGVETAPGNQGIPIVPEGAPGGFEGGLG